MLSWVEYWKELLGYIGEIGQIAPDTVKGYETLSAATTGSLDAKTRGLIALAVAATAHCDGYITVHTTGVIKHSATHGEIAGVLSVVISLNTGAMLVYSTHMLDVV